MKHFLELTPEQFAGIESPFLALHKPTYSQGDELVVSVKDHREQVVLTITKVITEKVNGKWCYLSLDGIGQVHKNDSQKGSEG